MCKYGTAAILCLMFECEDMFGEDSAEALACFLILTDMRTVAVILI